MYEDCIRVNVEVCLGKIVKIKVTRMLMYRLRTIQNKVQYSM